MRPAARAFAEVFPAARPWQLLDDQLLPLAEAAGGLTPALHQRMQRLIQYALDGAADAVQLACSMYGPVAANFDQQVPVRASDQGMFEELATVGSGRLLVVGSLAPAVSDAVQRLIGFLDSQHRLGSSVEVVGTVLAGAADAVRAGELDRLAELLVAAVYEQPIEPAAVVIAQYSVAQAYQAAAGRLPVPLLSPPHLAARSLRGLLGGGPA